MAKNKEKEMAQMMKSKFGIVKNSQGYDVNSIEDQWVCFSAHILVGKIIKNCRANEVPVAIFSLFFQCNAGV